MNLTLNEARTDPFTAIGKGVQVKTLKWQLYQDHGRHE